MEEEHKKENIRVSWKRNTIIRHKESGHPFLVVHVFKNICTLVVSLEDKHLLSSIYALLPREYNKYAPDADMKCEEQNERVTNWQYDPSLSFPHLTL